MDSKSKMTVCGGCANDGSFLRQACMFGKSVSGVRCGGVGLVSAHSTTNNVLLKCTISTCPTLKSILAMAVSAKMRLKYSLVLFQDFFCVVK